MDLTTSPFKRLRLATGLGRAEFLATVLISKTTLIYLDAGLYESVPTRVSEPLLAMCTDKGVDVAGVLREYGADTLDGATVRWQKAVRAQYHERLVAALVDADDLIDLGETVFGTMDAACKALKIPTGPVYQYVSGELKGLPKVIRTALTDAGLTEQQITGLDRHAPVPA